MLTLRPFFLIVELGDGDGECEQRAERLFEVQMEVVLVDLSKLRPHIIRVVRGHLQQHEKKE